MCCFVVSVNIPGSDRVRIREIVIFKFICNILKFRVLSRYHTAGEQGLRVDQDQTVK